MSIGMNSSSIMQANPPYIRFEVRAVEKRKPETEGAGVFYVDTDFALVTSHGSKDTVEKIAVEWFDHLKEQVRQGRFPQQWLDAFLANYRAWKNDQEPPVVGTSIKNWPAASPAEMKMLAGFGIRAVEDLANANEELIHRLGMGGRSLCARAKDWVTSKDGTAPLVLQVDAMRQSQRGMEQQLKDLIESNRVLKLQLEQRTSMIQASAASGAPASLEDRLLEAQATAGRGMTDSEAVDEALAEE